MPNNSDILKAVSASSSLSTSPLFSPPSSATTISGSSSASTGLDFCSWPLALNFENSVINGSSSSNSTSAFMPLALESATSAAIATLNSEMNRNTAASNSLDNLDFAGNSSNDLSKLKVRIAAEMLCKLII